MNHVRQQEVHPGMRRGRRGNVKARVRACLSSAPECIVTYLTGLSTDYPRTFLLSFGHFIIACAFMCVNVNSCVCSLEDFSCVE